MDPRKKLDDQLEGNRPNDQERLFDPDDFPTLPSPDDAHHEAHRRGIKTAEQVPYYERESTDIILSDSLECPLPEDTPEKTFKNLFLQTFCKGATIDEEGEAHFFYPKTFLAATGRQIHRHRVEEEQYAFGLNAIVDIKNFPQYAEKQSVQDAAKMAIDEYLDPGLFAGNFTAESELSEIYKFLSPETRTDVLFAECWDAAKAKRTGGIEHIMEHFENRKTQKRGWKKLF